MSRQLDASAAYAEKHGLDLDQSLQDHGVSAFKGAHRGPGTALGRFLDLVGQGVIQPGSYLLIDSFDRLSREEIMPAMGLLTSIIAAGITVVTLADNRDFHAKSNMMDMMWATMQMARANAESEEKGRKVRDARKRERQRARDELRPSTSNGPHWLQLVIAPDGRPVWEERADRVAVIRRIFDLKEYGLGYAKIARQMNDEHVPTPRGRGGWSEATVSDLVNSRAVLGAYQPWRRDEANIRVKEGGEVAGFYPQIISDEQFYRIQAAITNRRNPDARPGQKEFRNLLVGLVTCEVCGGTVGYLRSTFPRRPHWKASGVLRCNARNSGRCDNQLRLPYDRLEAELWPMISRLPGYSKRAQVDLNRLGGAQTKRAVLAEKIERLIDDLELGASVKRRIAEREAELRALDTEISRLEEQARIAGGALGAADLRQRIETLQADYDGADDEKRYRIRAKLNAMLAASVRPMTMTRARLRVEVSGEVAVQLVSPRERVIAREPSPFQRSELIEWHVVSDGAPGKDESRDRPEDSFSPTSSSSWSSE